MALLHPRFSHHTKWLAFRLGHLGDVALATGVLAHLGKQHGLRFHAMTASAWEPVFAEHPFIERTLTFDKGRSMTEEFSFFSALAKEYAGWGLLDLHGTLRSRLLGSLWKGPVARYPKMSLERRCFLHWPHATLKKKLQALRVPQRYALALEQTPTPAAQLLPRLWLNNAETQKAQSALHSLYGSTKPVALHPFATHALKSWPAHYWQQLIHLLDKAHIPFLIIGKGTPLLPGNPADFVNATSLRETCALLSQCQALVTGDSGPMHLATAVGTPVVAFFGPTIEEWGFFPSGPHDIVLQQPLSCRPCSLHGNATCPRNGQCLQEITPQQIFQALELQRQKNHGHHTMPEASW